MAIICPYCKHSMNAKSVRAGRFTPKCSKCTKSFQLVVKTDPQLTFVVTPLSVPDSNPSSVSDVTVPATKGSAQDPSFSVTPSAVAIPVASITDDRTTALEQTQPPFSQSAGNLEVTEAEGIPPEKKAVQTNSGLSIPETLGGFQIIKELGRGGMGAVYLARQISLDRPVALKVMNEEWAKNPNFLVRFTREAYAAAQLVHHNIIQVYDIGEEGGINYFSMEYVEGQSLGSLVKEKGRLDPEEAAGYILQAARGLKYAHDRGMIHRDIKPDNLMLNTQGIVKVADLGLVRTPGMIEEKLPSLEASTPPPEAIPISTSPSKSGAPRSLSSLSGVTLAGQAMGTPAYMAPEQARDATSVDHRADIYSLGCTLFVLITGRPVFQGSSALEVMTKHAFEPVVRPEKVVASVPKALSDIILKMIAKKPEERYTSMGEVLQVIEDFLGLHAAGKQATSEQHIRTLEQCVRDFRKTPLRALRSYILLAFFGGISALIVLCVLFGLWRFTGVFIGLGTLTLTAYFVVHGLTHRTKEFLDLRDLLLTSSWSDWGRLAGGLLLFALFLFLFGQFWFWLLAGLLGTGLAFGLHYGLDRRITREQEAALNKVESMLKTLRLRGLSEEALQEFVCKYAGENWEEFFEALFGYEAKLSARLQYGMGPKGPRPRYASWREPFIRWIERTQRARQEARERKHLQLIEQKNLEAQGVNAAEARVQAEAVADAVVLKASQIKEVPASPPADERTVAPEEGQLATRVEKTAPPRRVNLQDMLEIGVKTEQVPIKRRRSPLPKLLAIPFGGTVRLILGMFFIGNGIFWLFSRNLLPSSENYDNAQLWSQIWQQGMKNPTPIPLPFLPPPIQQALAGISPLIAGVLLFLSAHWLSWKIGMLVLIGAAIMVIGPVSGYIPQVGSLSPIISCFLVGGGVAILGFLFGRDT